MLTNRVQPTFPSEFVFGAATAAYQIEGAADEDGRGRTIWDTFAHQAGRIADGTTGDVACDHYHRLETDLDLMTDLGLTAYRFSIAWSRVLPSGDGVVNPNGIAFYERLVDGLLARGIEPFPTLFHWDTPQAIYERNGGFQSRDTAQCFAEYAALIAERLGDRVQHWITINEPWEHTFMGHFEGIHAPGLQRPEAFLPVMHHLLLGHGLATQAIRSVQSDADIGITLSFTPMHPIDEREENVAAADRLNEFVNFVTLDPLLRGHYPPELWARMATLRPQVENGDMEIIQAPIDFIGVNNYQREFAQYAPEAPILEASSPGPVEPPPTEFWEDGKLISTMGWEVYPQAMGEVLGWLRDDYGNPTVYITENGIALNDSVEQGRVRDPLRRDFLNDHLIEIQSAINAGSDVRGYFVWSLMDNFEWAVGSEKRFGLIHVDYGTLERTIKDSGLWYRDIIKASRNKSGQHSPA